MTKVFISYKTGVPNDQEAELLYNELTSQGFSVFLDKREFHAGISWDESIYNNISDSDVMIVFITADAHSPWVQREVDFALGCRIRVLPVIIRSEDLSRADTVMKKLAIEKLQYAKAYGSNKPTIRYAEVVEAISILASETRIQQDGWLKQLQEKWRKEDASNHLLQPPRPTNLEYANYAFFPNVRHAHSCTIHLAAGSITEVQGIDVLVNSENVYMQMQRVFARESVSKRIRIDGARLRGRHFIEEDTIQQELNSQLFGPGGGVPVSQGTVIVTSAGSHGSKLNSRGIRYIFHVAVVDANTDKEHLVEKPEIVGECVKTCFERIGALNANNEHIHSIIFPVLASGNAGLDLSISARAILEEIKRFLTANPDTEMSHIYLAAYTSGDAQELERLLGGDQQLRRIPQTS